MKKLLCIFILASLLVLSTVVPAFAMSNPDKTIDIYSFEDLENAMDNIKYGDHWQLDIYNDIEFTDTITVNGDDLIIEFNNCTGKDEAIFTIGNFIGLYIKWGSNNCKLQFNNITFSGKTYTSPETACDGNGIYVGQYSEGTKIDGAKFENLGYNHSNTRSDFLFGSFYINGYGGGMCINSEEVTISNCVFEKCSAGYGGGIDINNDVVTIDHCTFDACWAVYGGGIYAESNVSDAYITNCTFLNSVTLSDVGIAVYGSGENNTFVYNSGENVYGGGWFSNCTVDSNYSGSFLSTGNIVILSAIVVLAGIAAFVFIKRKKHSKA